MVYDGFDGYEVWVLCCMNWSLTLIAGVGFCIWLFGFVRMVDVCFVIHAYLLWLIVLFNLFIFCVVDVWLLGFSWLC